SRTVAAFVRLALALKGRPSRSVRRPESILPTACSTDEWGPGPSPGSFNLTVEPNVFHAIAVEQAVDHDRQSLDVGVPARPLPTVEDDWPRTVLGQRILDRPHQPFALPLIAFDRLLLDQLVDFGVAVAVP